jgi:hypothetical protein
MPRKAAGNRLELETERRVNDRIVREEVDSSTAAKTVSGWEL